VSDSLRFVMLKYRDSDGVHSLGRVPLTRHRIASQARRVSPVSTSCALAVPTEQRAATRATMESSFFFMVNSPWLRSLSSRPCSRLANAATSDSGSAELSAPARLLSPKLGAGCWSGTSMFVGRAASALRLDRGGDLSASGVGDPFGAESRRLSAALATSARFPSPSSRRRRP
jgi:hypothetical protein